MKRIISVISVFLFIISISFFIFNKQSYKKVEDINDKRIVEYYEKTNEEIAQEKYIGILEIPAIKLKRGFFSFNSKENTVKKNIMLINGSIMPDVENSILILAAHRGNAKNSYFNNLYKLNIGDTIFINYKGNRYKYILKEIYDVEKDGNLEIRKYPNTNELVLITCKKESKNLQSIYIAFQT